MFIDTHTHLNFKEYQNDLPQVIERAQKARVLKMIVVGSDVWNSKSAIKLAQKHKGLYATVGLHPLHIKGGWGLLTRDGLPASFIVEDYIPNNHGTTLTIEELEEMLSRKEVVALGEVGLDYHHGGEEEGLKINRDVQCTSLGVLIDVAIRTDIPAIFHCREAMKDFIHCLKKKKVKGVVHCFPGDVNEAKIILGKGLYISFTGIITFSKEYDEVIKYAPLDRIMLETDCPFLAPEPYRGKRNEPAFMVEVAKRIAILKNIPPAKVEEETTKNAIDLFELS